MSDQVTLYIFVWLIAIAILAIGIAELEAWRDARLLKKRRRAR